MAVPMNYIITSGLIAGVFHLDTFYDLTVLSYDIVWLQKGRSQYLVSWWREQSLNAGYLEEFIYNPHYNALTEFEMLASGTLCEFL